jgi:hypothetical protein
MRWVATFGTAGFREELLAATRSLKHRLLGLYQKRTFLIQLVLGDSPFSD